MSQSLYSSIDSSRDAIRLLRVDLRDRRYHQLVQNIPLNISTYAALSYPWGGPSECSISVNSSSVNVSRNLTLALNDVIDFWTRTYPDRAELFLWTDQVCINQQDPKEKSHQVALMGEIYRHAYRTIVWLPIVSGVATGFKDWSSWRDWHRGQILDSNLQRLRGPSQALQYTNVEQHREDFTNNMLTHPHISAEEDRFRDVSVAWSHVHAIVRSSWWSRGWIYQEFMLPDKVTFLFDGIACPWEKLTELLLLYSSQRDAHVAAVTEKLNALKGVRPKSWMDMLIRSPKAPPKDHDTKAKQRKFLDAHGLEIMKAALSWQQVIFLVQSKTDRMKLRQVEENPHISLSKLLAHARNCQISEPRDRVYAFLALADPRYNVPVDYRGSTTNDVLVQAAKAIIERERRLDILAIAMENTRPYDESKRDVLPSWTPDWMNPDISDSWYKEFLRAIRLPVTGYTLPIYSGSGASRVSRDKPPEVSFQPDHHNRVDRILQAKGIRIDEFTKAISSPDPGKFQTFRGRSSLEFDTVPEARVGDEAWVLFGADEPFTLRRQGGAFRLLGHTTVREVDLVGEADFRNSYPLHGQFIDQLKSRERVEAVVRLV